MKLWSLVATSEILYRQALIGRAREPFCKRKGSRKLIMDRDWPQKLSSGWFLTAEICSGLRRALTCDCHRRTLCLYRFSFLLLSVTGALPPYPHELFVEKQVGKQVFNYQKLLFPFGAYWTRESRGRTICARARLFNLHLTDNANRTRHYAA